MQRPPEALTGDALDRVYPIGCQVRAIARTTRGNPREGILGMAGIVTEYDNAGPGVGHCGVMVRFPHDGRSWYMWTTEIELVTAATPAIPGRPVVGNIVRSLGIYGMERGLSREMTGRVVMLRGEDILVDWGPLVDGHDGDGAILTATGLYMRPEQIEVISGGIPGIGIPGTTAATIPTIPSIPSIPRLRVTITPPPNEYEQWQLQIDNGPAITSADIRAQMPREYQRLIPTRVWTASSIAQRLVHRAITEHAIPVEVLLAACQAAAIAKQSQDRHGVFSSEVGLPANLAEMVASSPPLLAIGDKLFSLMPQGVISGARGMALIRAKTIERAKESAERLLTAARAEARGIIASGERKLAEIRSTIAAETTAGALRLPEWVISNHHVVRVRGSGEETYPWDIGFWINTKVEGFVMGSMSGDYTLEWPAVSLETAPRSVMVWMPINLSSGAFHYTRTRVAEHQGGSLPHIHEHCCMELQGLPAVISNHRQFLSVRDGLNRGQRVVNLSSLLVGIDLWHPDVVAMTPAPIRTYLNSRRREPDIATLELTAANRVSIHEEAAETFNIEDVHRAVVGAPATMEEE